MILQKIQSTKMKELTSFDVYNLANEAKPLIDGKIDNIYQMDAKDIYLQIYIKDKPKQLLRIEAGKCFYLAGKKPEFPENVQRFCSFLRKYLLNSKIRAFTQVDSERIIKISFENRTDLIDMYVELFGKGNIIIVMNNKIISVAEEQIWADRLLKAGETYVYPNKEDSKQIFEKQKAKGIFVTMKMLDEELSKNITTKKITAKDKEMHKIKTIIEKQTEQLNKVVRESEENKKKGELIYEKYQELKELMQNKAKNKEGKLVVDL